MKKSLLFILLFLLFWGCSRSEKSDDAKQPAAVAKAETLATGDLLFVGIPGDYNLEGISSAIADATGYGDTNFIHTAIIEVDGDGQAWIIDATLKRGVARYPIDTFLTDFTLNDGSLPALVVMRLADTTGCSRFVANAKGFLGEPYDAYFTPDNDKHYCTELVYDAYIRDGKHLFTARPMNFKNADGEFPLYWTQLFHAIGAKIPQDELGTNPQEMRMEPVLKRVNIDIAAVQ